MNSRGSGGTALPRRIELAAHSKRTLAAVIALLPAFAWALGTPAGTPVDNTATVDYEIGGVPGTSTSNTDSFLVAELLDTTLASNDAGNVAAFSPDSGIALSFTLTNTGNGSETFALTFDAALGGDQFDPQAVQIYLDDGDGLFDSAIDTLYAPGINDPVLAADDSRVLFIVGDMPGSLAGGDLGAAQLTATAATGSGAPGTAFNGAGDGGVDALVGASGASASDQNAYVITAYASLAKASVVLDPLGGSSPVPGAVITYTLTFAVPAGVNVTAAQVTDAIPAGTTYQPGSLTLDAAALTDATGDDAGEFAAGSIAVDLGNVAGPATHTIVFNVSIN